jgi:hypothetical protein
VLLLLFNAMGFYGLFVGLRFKTASDLVKRLDNQHYDEEETITVKVPITVPYTLSSSKEYERVDGEVEHQGEFYRLIKQKFENDTLYIVCIKDYESKRIHKALGDYVKTFTDDPMHGKNSSKSLPTFIKDFLPTSFKITHSSKGWNYSLVANSFNQFFYSRTLSVVTPPPQA